MGNLKLVSRAACFDGIQAVYTHRSCETKTDMTFGLFLPPQAERKPVPVLTYLSGLTCTHENVIQKAGAQRYCAERGIALLAPDTSPRGLELDGEHDDYDFGSGAGFYVDATQPDWATNYRMYSYVTEELRDVVAKNFASLDLTRSGIAGHSMGGHGALVIGLRNPSLYQSVSAFSPICSPGQCPWGVKALDGYLGSYQPAWRAYDACALISDGAWAKEILVDQGLDDEFLSDQLKPELLEHACADADIALTMRKHEGYDHSYYFIASFIGDHIDWAADRLCV